MLEEMIQFIRWIVVADAITMNGELMTWQTSNFESDMSPDAVTLTHVNEYEMTSYSIDFDGFNVFKIEYKFTSDSPLVSLESKKQITCAIVTIRDDAGVEVEYTFRRLYYEKG